MDAQLSAELAPWLWLAAGILLCAGETLAPGMFLLWIGLAALATGLMVLVFPLGLPSMLVLFGIFAVVASLIGRRIYGSQGGTGDKPFLNRRADALVGRRFQLESPIRSGEGSIRVNDSVWRVRGPDLPAGTRVKVMAVEDGVMLRVEQA